MLSLKNKRVLLGMTGGIAAYKSAEILRRLQDAGAEVRVVMTKGAQEFITPLTMQALSGNPVHTDLLDPKAEAAMGHIEFSRWADVILVAPASANFLAKLAVGEASDLLSTLCLAANGAVALAPAMNQGMWLNPATQKNVVTLQERGVHFIGPADGGQACGDVGPGRMAEPLFVAQELAKLFETGVMAGKTVLITAGPTREAIDPVRYISNHSSGKMGYALAEAAMEAGASVILVSGPVQLDPPDRVETHYVESANEMHDMVMAHVKKADVVIAAAAVADYRPKTVAEKKLKKGASAEFTIEMIENPDIVASVASLKARPFTIGFAAETNDLLAFARVKREKKNLDLIVANNVASSDIGFNSDNNEVTVIGEAEEVTYSTRNKGQLARDLITYIADQMTSS